MNYECQPKRMMPENEAIDFQNLESDQQETEDKVLARCEQKIARVEKLLAEYLFNMRDERRRLLATNQDVDTLLSEIDSFLRSLGEKNLD